MPKRVKHEVKPEGLFRKGQSFHFAGGSLNQLPIDAAVQSMFAMVVCFAFACEAYLKVLAILERGLRPLETHHLVFLLHELDADTQRRIEERWVAEYLPGIRDGWDHPDIPKALTPPQTFQQALDQSSRAFVDWRYGDSEVKPLNFHMIGLAPILRQIILERKPEWRKWIAPVSKFPRRA